MTQRLGIFLGEVSSEEFSFSLEREINGFPPDCLPISDQRRLADGCNPKRASRSLFVLASTLVCYLGVWQCDNGCETTAYGQSSQGDKNITFGTCCWSLHNNCLQCFLHKLALSHSFFFLFHFFLIKEKKNTTHLETRLKKTTSCLCSWAGQAGSCL